MQYKHTSSLIPRVPCEPVALPSALQIPLNDYTLDVGLFVSIARLS